MRYFKLFYDYENHDKAVCCKITNLAGINRYDVEEGEPITKWDSNVTFSFDSTEGQIMKDLLGNNLGWLIISEKLKKFLQDERIKGIQYLPVKILDTSNNQKFVDYYVMNIVNTVDALDLESSKYDVFEVDDNEKIICVEKYAIQYNCIKGMDVFKLENDTIPTFVSEKIVNLILEKGITGCTFLEIKVT